MAHEPSRADITGIAAILTAAADLLEKPGAWTQRTFARDHAGEPVHSTSRKACSWCVVGAIEVARGDRDAFAVVYALDAVEPFTDPRVDRWNDAPERTQEEVVAALRAAAAKADGSASDRATADAEPSMGRLANHTNTESQQ